MQEIKYCIGIRQNQKITDMRQNTTHYTYYKMPFPFIPLEKTASDVSEHYTHFVLSKRISLQHF